MVVSSWPSPSRSLKPSIMPSPSTSLPPASDVSVSPSLSESRSRLSGIPSASVSTVPSVRSGIPSLSSSRSSESGIPSPSASASTSTVTIATFDTLPAASLTV